MKNGAWRHHHLDTGDLALAEAGKILDAGHVGIDRANAETRAHVLIALARAHYRAVEVETNATVTQ